MLPTVRSKLGALKYISKIIPKKGRKLLVEGIILSKIMYLIPMWGGSPKKYMKKVQVLINKSARLVLKTSRLTSTKKLMTETGWFYATEMALYHTMLLTWKLIRQGTPEYFSDIIVVEDEDYLTTRAPRLKITATRYRCICVTQWNRLPDEIRGGTHIVGPTIPIFKQDGIHSQGPTPPPHSIFCT